MQVVTPPADIEKYRLNHWPKIFLAGSIEMGAADDWQKKIIVDLKQVKSLKTAIVMNPRRHDWDSSWVQSITHKNFREQVLWELLAIDCADHVLLYLDPETKSPISLMELGMLGDSRKVNVCCPWGFWRSGNVEIFCSFKRIPLCHSIEELVPGMVSRLGLI